MKAEHRKELETNVLADRMGRFVQNMKHRPKRRILLWIVVVAVLVVGLFVYVSVRKANQLEASELWQKLEDGFPPYINELRSKDKDTNAGKAARFQFAWLAAWDKGMMELGGSPVVAMDNMALAAKMYDDLAKECSGDPVWEPEALYGLAVIAETRAIRAKNRETSIDPAKKLYRELASAYPDSAHGKLASKRAQFLEKNARQVAEFYAELEFRLNIEQQFADAEKSPKTTQKQPKK
jgi:hypothetical protein